MTRTPGPCSNESSNILFHKGFAMTIRRFRSPMKMCAALIAIAFFLTLGQGAVSSVLAADPPVDPPAPPAAGSDGVGDLAEEARGRHRGRRGRRSENVFRHFRRHVGLDRGRHRGGDPDRRGGSRRQWRQQQFASGVQPVTDSSVFPV